MAINSLAHTSTDDHRTTDGFPMSSHAVRAQYVNQYRSSGQSSAPVIENSFSSFKYF